MIHPVTVSFNLEPIEGHVGTGTVVAVLQPSAEVDDSVSTLIPLLVESTITAWTGTINLYTADPGGLVWTFNLTIDGTPVQSTKLITVSQAPSVGYQNLTSVVIPPTVNYVPSGPPGQTGPVGPAPVITAAPGGNIVIGGTPTAPTIGVQSGAYAPVVKPLEAMPVFLYTDSYGHSPGIDCTPGAEWFVRLTRRLGLGALNNYQVDGYDAIMACQRALTGSPFDADAVAIAAAGQWSPTNGLPVVDIGKNNNYYTGNTAATTNTVTQAVTELLAILSCGTRVEDTDPSVAYSGTGWTTGTGTPMYSAGANHHDYPATVGDTVTVTLPGPGSYWLFATVLDPALGFAQNNYGVTVSGVSQPDWVMAPIKANRNGYTGYCPTAYKVTATGGGTHPVVLTVKGTGSFANFDFYAPLLASPPPILLRKQVSFNPAYIGGWPGGGGGGGSTAGLAAVNTALTAVAARFPNVIVSDPTVAWDPTTCIGADGLHPTDVGMSVIADADQAALQAAVTSFAAGLNR